MLSYARGPDAPILEQTISQMLAETAMKYAANDALIVRHQQMRLTWRELAAEVDRTARGLIGLGLQPGDRVGVWSSNCIEWVLLQLACARAGVVLVNVNPAYRSHELRFVLQRSRMKALFLWEVDRRANYLEILNESRDGKDVPLEHVVMLGQPSWDAMISNGRDLPPLPADCEEVVNIQYTSGTTGSPKGVLLSHRNLLNNGALIARCLRLSEQDRICVPVPMYHCFGCVIGTMVSLTSGAAMILPSAQFEALATLEAIHHERATAIYGVPTMFIAELEHPRFVEFNMDSLRTGVMAGSPCPIELMKRVCTDMSCREMTIGYGQTECSPICTMSRVDDSLELRVSTVGCAMPCTEVKIISTDSGETVPTGEQGELCTRGYLVMKGYDGDPEATRRAVDSDGWLHTGDLASMQPDGYFRITGRARDLIIRGGENVYPREVEEFLYTHPAISDVSVFGVPDVKLGESVSAWVRLRSGATASEDDIRSFCRGKIAHFKIPQYIRFVDSFPLTVTGKIQKFRMREEEIVKRGLEHAARIQTA